MKNIDLTGSRILIAPVRIICAVLSIFASYHYLIDLLEISMKFHEISRILAIAILVSIELILMSFIYFSFRYWRRKDFRLAMAYTCSCILILSVSFLLTSHGFYSLYGKHNDNKEEIAFNQEQILTDKLNRINDRIKIYENQFETYRNININWLNNKAVTGQITIINDQLKSLNAEKTNLIKETEAETIRLIHENERKNTEAKYKYWYFSIILLVFIVFFNSLDSFFAERLFCTEKQDISSEISEIKNEISENRNEISEQENEISNETIRNLTDYQKELLLKIQDSDLTMKDKFLLLKQHFSQKQIAGLLNTSAATISRLNKNNH